MRTAIFSEAARHQKAGEPIVGVAVRTRRLMRFGWDLSGARQ